MKSEWKLSPPEFEHVTGTYQQKIRKRQ